MYIIKINKKRGHEFEKKVRRSESLDLGKKEENNAIML